MRCQTSTTDIHHVGSTLDIEKLCKTSSSRDFQTKSFCIVAWFCVTVFVRQKLSVQIEQVKTTSNNKIWQKEIQLKKKEGCKKKHTHRNLCDGNRARFDRTTHCLRVNMECVGRSVGCLLHSPDVLKSQIALSHANPLLVVFHVHELAVRATRSKSRIRVGFPQSIRDILCIGPEANQKVGHSRRFLRGRT